MKYEKPLLKEYGDLKDITRGAWAGGGDGIPQRYEGHNIKLFLFSNHNTNVTIFPNIIRIRYLEEPGFNLYC